MSDKNIIDLKRVVDVLKSGGVIITPSESCYGLSCDAKNAEAVKRINGIKESREGMALTLLAASLTQILEFGKLNNAAIKLSEHFHPGPINLIIDLVENKDLSYLSVDGIAFRIPKNLILQRVLEEFGSPITTTSANFHAGPPLYNFDEVFNDFGNKVDYIIDAGNLNSQILPSTVFDTRNMKLLRKGPISIDQIMDVINA